MLREHGTSAGIGKASREKVWEHDENHTVRDHSEAFSLKLKGTLEAMKSGLFIFQMRS